MRTLRLTLLILITSLFLASCEKEDIPVTLPEQGAASHARVDMGEDYTDQVFFDIESNAIVSTSLVTSWDLAFETNTIGTHIYVNGGKDIFVYHTHSSDFNNINAVPAKLSEKDWKVDAPSGVKDSTAIGDWTNGTGLSRNEVYILKLNPAHFADTFKKITIVAADANKYVMTYSDLKEHNVKTIIVPKDADYNFTYFTFADGGHIVYPEPPKHTWDIVFTRYRHVYHDLDDFPYIVSGVLLNPYNTMAVKDSTTEYQNITVSSIASARFLSARDVIGFDWKTYDFDKGRYSITPKRSYMIKTRTGEYWKLRFLDFYSEKGVKGSPSFEFERLQ